MITKARELTHKAQNSNTTVNTSIVYSSLGENNTSLHFQFQECPCITAREAVFGGAVLEGSTVSRVERTNKWIRYKQFWIATVDLTLPDRGVVLWVMIRLVDLYTLWRPLHIQESWNTDNVRASRTRLSGNHNLHSQHLDVWRLGRIYYIVLNWCKSWSIFSIILCLTL